MNRAMRRALAFNRTELLFSPNREDHQIFTNYEKNKAIQGSEDYYWNLYMQDDVGKCHQHYIDDLTDIWSVTH